jgi:glucokinase
MPEVFAIGIDIGATNTKIGLVNAEGQLFDPQTLRSALRTPDPGPYLAAVSAAVDRLRAGRPLKGIGIALCSLINAERSGAFLAVNAPALNDLNIRQVFADRFGCPVQVINDVNAYALAEAAYGAGRGARRLLCLALGTGLAISAMIDGRLIETWGGVPADAARIVLEPGADVTCNGGVRGSAEALCGTAAIERLAQREVPLAGWSARAVIDAAREGREPAAGRIMAEIGGHVGHLLAILSPIFFPQRILVTGGTAEAGEPLFAAIRARFTALIGSYMANLASLETGVASPVEICKGALGPEAAIIGTTCAFFE